MNDLSCKDSARTVLLIGGTGFVCMNIAELLLDNGINVVLLARNSLDEVAASELSDKPGKLIFFKGDVLDKKSLDDVIKLNGVTDVIHGAAITPSMEMEMLHAKKVIEVNCIGLMNMLDVCRINGVNRFIYLGSISAYGKTAFESKELIEDVSIAKPYSLYEISKFTGERIVLRYRELYSMDAYVARVGDVFGPWERHTGVRTFMSFPYQTTYKAVQGEKVILPRPTYIDWVYGRDVAGSVKAILCAQKLNYSIYPICSGYRWPITDWCELLKCKFKDFDYKLAGEGEEATIRVNQEKDNAPMQTNRLVEDVDYTPVYDLKRAFEDYMQWLEKHSGYLTRD